ncbi:MAG TPA: LPS export ABC transporter periplasmic protein LptC [Gemmatimonadaceae bacterium]|nr:LPS export ABC transporter periplasmic protein LptC [Gemmatimonadaceae bacterium]
MQRALGLVIVAAALVACTSKKQPPVANHSPLADSADQVMYNSRFVLADLGINRAQMHSDTAYFFDDNTRMEFENPVVTFFTTTGAKDAVLTARHGTYNNRTSNMIARKNVVVVSEDGRRLTTSELIYNQQKNEISSDSAFLLTEPGRQVSGVGFRSDPNMKNILILSGASGIARGVSTGAATQSPTGATPAAQKPAGPAASSTPPRH